MFNSRKNITIQRRHRVLTAHKLKRGLESKNNYLREFSSITSLHGIMYLGEPNRPLLER